MNIFDKEIDRTNTHCEKWDKYKGQDVIPAWVADMDFSSPMCIIEALGRRVEHGIFGYTAIDEDTYDSVINFIKRHHNWEIKKEWIVWVNGVVPSMNIACKILNDKEKVITTTPIYPHFVKAPKNANKKLAQVPLKEINNRWIIDFDEFESKISSTCKLFLFCNPHNPGGTVFNKDELEKISDICIKHDLIICTDEIHADLVINPKAKHIPIASLNDEIKERSITLMAPSKTFNIAGLQSSYAIIPNKDLRLKFQKELRGMGSGINLLAITATKSAYNNGDIWLSELKKYLLENYELIKSFVYENKDLKMLSNDATFLAWIDCSLLHVKSPYELFLKYGLGLSDGSAFGDTSFVRLNFATTKKNLQEILFRMQDAIDNLSK